MTIKKIVVPVFVYTLLLTSQISFAQGINFKNEPWQKIVQKAKKQHKLIFLQLESNTCEECIAVANQAFQNPILVDAFNQNFISVRINGATDEGKRLSKKFFVSSLPTALFISDRENLLSRYNGSTNNPSVYIFYANKAIENRDAVSLEELDEEYKSGIRKPSFLKAYISKRKELNIPIDSLLEEYVSSLPEDSLHTFEVLNFIYENAPLLGSEAFKILQSNREAMSKVYQVAGYEKRKGINNEIILKTRQKAIEEKNFDLAKKVAGFTKSTWGNDYINGEKNYDYNILEYYKGIRDTANLIHKVIQYYNTYYMPKDLDSLKIAENKAIQNSLKKIPVDTIQTDEGMILRRKVVRSPAQFDFGNSLNEGAWDLYLYATEKKDLETGLNWAKRAVDYVENPAYIDTYAHLLYRLNRNEEAVEWERKAVDMSKNKTRDFSVNTYQSELDKMKKGIL